MQYDPYTGQPIYTAQDLGMYQASDPYMYQLMLQAQAQAQAEQQGGGGSSSSGGGTAAGGGGTAAALAKLAMKYYGKQAAGQAGAQAGAQAGTQAGIQAGQQAATQAGAYGAGLGGATAAASANAATQAGLAASQAAATSSGAAGAGLGGQFANQSVNLAAQGGTQAGAQSGTQAATTGVSSATLATTAGVLAAIYQMYQSMKGVKDAEKAAGTKLTDEEIENSGDPFGGKYKDYSLLHKMGGPAEYFSPFTWKNHFLKNTFGTTKDKYNIYRDRVRNAMADGDYLGTDDEGRRYMELADGSRFDFQTEGRTFKGQDGQDVRYGDQFDESNPLLAQAQGGINPLMNILFDGEEGVPGFDAGYTNAVLSNANNEKELFENIAHQYGRMGLDQTSATDIINRQQEEGKLSQAEADAARVSIYKALDPEGYERDRPKDGSGAERAAIQIENTPGGPSTPGSRAAGQPLPYGERTIGPAPAPSPQPEIEVQDPQSLYQPSVGAPAAQNGVTSTLDLDALVQQYPDLQQAQQTYNQMSPETQALLRQQGVIV